MKNKSPELFQKKWNNLLSQLKNSQIKWDKKNALKFKIINPYNDSTDFYIVLDDESQNIINFFMVTEFLPQGHVHVPKHIHNFKFSNTIDELFLTKQEIYNLYLYGYKNNYLFHEYKNELEYYQEEIKSIKNKFFEYDEDDYFDNTDIFQTYDNCRAYYYELLKSLEVKKINTYEKYIELYLEKKFEKIFNSF